MKTLYVRSDGTAVGTIVTDEAGGFVRGLKRLVLDIDADKRVLKAEGIFYGDKIVDHDFPLYTEEVFIKEFILENAFEGASQLGVNNG